MKKIITSLLSIMGLIGMISAQSFDITNVSVKEDSKLQLLHFSIDVAGLAGDSIPTPNGALDGAPVLGYVFPTTLIPTDVGFDNTPGIVALALTSHPDFDDTPLWDENLDAIYDNDGVVWHSHWVLLEENLSVPGGLAVKATTANSQLPPTNPGMPMYMDSPGYSVVWKDHTITCAVPLFRMNNQTDFKYDGVTALMTVNTSDPNRPLLGVYEVYAVASGDLSLPYEVGTYSCDTLIMDISLSTIGIVNPETIKLYPNPIGGDSQLQIGLSTEFDLSAYTINFYASSGALVYTTDLDNNVLSIATAAIGSAGIYTVQVVDKNTSIVKGVKQLILQ